MDRKVYVQNQVDFLNRTTEDYNNVRQNGRPRKGKSFYTSCTKLILLKAS